jgi:uncharacterized damage-inducible protein DinB
MEKDPKYPIGKYEAQPFSESQKKNWIVDIQFLPNELEQAIENLDEAQLHTPYRDGGWTVHQLVHHIADSHMNSFIRFKLALTEDNPTIKPYDENAWSEMADVQKEPINVSITLLYALHKRWLTLLQNMSDADFEKTLFNPQRRGQLTLWEMLGIYAWHGKHHVAHIKTLKENKGW